MRDGQHALVLLAALSLSCLVATTAIAHGPDQIIQETFVFVDGDKVTVEYHTAYGAILARVKLISADKDGDGSLSDAEREGLLARSSAEILSKLQVTADASAVELAYADGRLVAPPLRKLADTATIVLRLEGKLPARSTEGESLVLRVADSNFSAATLGHMTYYVRPGPETRSLRVGGNSRILEWTLVPSTTRAGGEGHAGTAELHASKHGMDDWQDEGGTLVAYIQSGELTLGFLVVTMIVAAGLGAMHALSPGHGKAMVAAYLIGSRGRVRDAVLLGGVVTFTHVFSVILIGVVALVLAEHLAPEDLYPWLGFASGALIFVIGYWMLAGRALGLGHTHSHAHAHSGHGQHPSAEHSHDHAHGHEHTHQHIEVHAHSGAQETADPHHHEHSAEDSTGGGHDHSHDHHGHDHDHGHHHPHDHDADDHGHDNGHSHDQGDAHHHEHARGHGHSHVPEGKITLWSLLTLGISGGMVPCPSALVVLLAAVAMHRIVFGMTLVLAFSVGLATVLILIGILAVTASRFMSRSFAEGRLVRALPVFSAGLIMVIGIALAFMSLLSGGILRAGL